MKIELSLDFTMYGIQPYLSQLRLTDFAENAHIETHVMGYRADAGASSDVPDDLLNLQFLAPAAVGARSAPGAFALQTAR
jgi:hypothetical protein